MKILVVGSDKIYAIENFYVKHLKAMGAKIIHFPAQSAFYDYYQSSLVNKIKFRLGLSTIYRMINDRLIELLKNEAPVVVWIFKGMEIYPETLLKIKNEGILLVNYNPDNPFLFSGSGSGNKNISGSISLYDLHFTYNLHTKKQLEEDYKAKTVWLPFGYDLDDELYKRCEVLEEINSVCFLGNPDKKRAEFIESLADEGVRISLYGNDWGKFLSGPNIEIHLPVYAEEQWATLRKYRVQLNLMRLHNEDSHNMRTFEVPGVGGIMVAPDTTEHKMFFDDNKEVFLFKNVEECADKIKWLLQLAKSGADEIRGRARERSLKSGYCYKMRSQQVLMELSQRIE